MRRRLCDIHSISEHEKLLLLLLTGLLLLQLIRMLLMLLFMGELCISLKLHMGWRGVRLEGRRGARVNSGSSPCV